MRNQHDLERTLRIALAALRDASASLYDVAGYLQEAEAGAYWGRSYELCGEALALKSRVSVLGRELRKAGKPPKPRKEAVTA